VLIAALSSRIKARLATPSCGFFSTCHKKYTIRNCAGICTLTVYRDISKLIYILCQSQKGTYILES
jgi:hypothetical protein